MSIDDSDSDALISRLAGPLSPRARESFRHAAEDAIARLPCAGEGAIYRAVSVLQRRFFNPPSSGRAQWDIGQERPSQLKRAPPIASTGDGRRVVQFRHAFRNTDNTDNTDMTSILQNIISTAFGDDENLPDEEIVVRARLCMRAAMSILSTIDSDAVFEAAIAELPADEQVLQREIRIRVKRFSEAITEAQTVSKH